MGVSVIVDAGAALAESAKRRLGCLVHVQLPRLADPHTKEDAVFMGIWPEFGFSHLISSHRVSRTV